MCEPATIAMATLALTAATTTASMVNQNQQIQHAKGAAQAQQTALDAQAKEVAKVGPAQQSTNVSANESLAASEAKRKAALRRGMLSTIASSGTEKTGNATPQPTAYAPGSKTTLG